MRLITIPMSHYCEKARWGLLHAGVDYVEDAHLQVFHYLAVRRYSRLGQVPILVTESGSVADSTAILQFLDECLPDARKLYPGEHRQEIETLEDGFDESLGIETRRWVYFHWLTRPVREVMLIAGQGTPAWQRVLAPWLFPMLRGYLNRALGISAAQVDAGLPIIEANFDAVAHRLEDGRRFLCGEQLSAADITFASLAAPILLPTEYGIRLPTLDQAPPSARPHIERFRSHPAGQFALRLYAERKRPAPVGPSIPRL